MKPQIHADERRLAELTVAIVGGSFRVPNKLGCGFVEKVYENWMADELREASLAVSQQARFSIFHDDVSMGEYLAEPVVAGEILVKIKTVKSIDDVHTGQRCNYLKASGLKVCLLMNFANPKVEMKRFVRNF